MFFFFRFAGSCVALRVGGGEAPSCLGRCDFKKPVFGFFDFARDAESEVVSECFIAAGIVFCGECSVNVFFLLSL
jgi:hypothetical protein